MAETSPSSPPPIADVGPVDYLPNADGYRDFDLLG